MVFSLMILDLSEKVDIDVREEVKLELAAVSLGNFDFAWLDEEAVKDLVDFGVSFCTADAIVFMSFLNDALSVRFGA